MSRVLALKYRPKRFEDLVGQHQITSTLIEALKRGRLSHAYLFSGLRGSGKTSSARIFSKSMLCQDGPTSTPCEICENCIMSNENRHPDIIEMDGASNRKIDDIRDLIEQTKYRPTSSRFKIFIIDEVHMLTKEAFNALLKTLEEPPEFVKFILATTDPLKLPATILSRVQHFRFKRVANSDILNHLIHILNLERVDYQKEALEIIVRSGSGSLRDTLTLLEQAIVFSKDVVDTQIVTDMLGLVDPKFIEETFKAIFSKDYSKVRETLKELELYESEMVIDEFIIFLKLKFQKNSQEFSTLILDRFFRILADSKSLLALNADDSFVLTLTLFKMIEALKLKDIDSMIESMELNSNQAQQSKAINSQISSYRELFKTLKSRISTYNLELGECFSQNVEFVDFRDNSLIWRSLAKGDCKESLKRDYKQIYQFVRDIFGSDTKIELATNESGKKKLSLVSEDIVKTEVFNRVKELFQVKKVNIRARV